MKAVIWLTLIVCLPAWALPVTARETTDTASPLARAITREATRLAATGEPTTPVIEPVQKDGRPVESDWTAVRTLAAGTEVVVTVKGFQAGSRYFALADESELTVLDLTDPMLPGAARRVLLDMVARHPEYFAGSPMRGTFESDDVRVGPDGVFVAGQRVGDLDHLVETVTRTDVSEIKRAVPVPRRSVARGVVWGLGGYFVGAMAGGAVGGTIACSVGRCENGLLGAFVGVVVGGVGGAIVGYSWGARASPSKPEEMIYRVP